MKYLVLLLLVCSALACSEKNDDARTARPGGGSGNDNNPQKPDSKRKNTTDYNVCGTGPSTLKTPEGRWEIFESAENFYFKIGLEFKSGTLTLRQDCYHKATRLTAEVMVPASYEDGIIKVLADASDVDKAGDKEGTFDCSVNLVKGVAKYGFAGHCLELGNFQGREYLKFAPQ